VTKEMHVKAPESFLRKKLLIATLIVTMLLAVVFSLLPLSPVSADNLVKSSKTITRDKTIKLLSMKGSFSASTMRMNHAFYVNGSFSVSNGAYSFLVNPPTGISSLTSELYSNSSHVAHKLSKSGNTIWIYYDFVNKSDGVKITITGTIASSATLVFPFVSSASKTYDSNKRYVLFGASDNGVGYSWTDASSGIYNQVSGTLSFSVGTNFKIDPSTVVSTSTLNTISYPFQDKTYYCVYNSKFYVFPVDSGTLVYYFSSDSVTWTKGTGTIYFIGGYDSGVYYDVAYDGNSNFYVSSAYGYSGSWKKCAVQSNGNLTIGSDNPFVLDAMESSIHNLGQFFDLNLVNATVSGNIYGLKQIGGLGTNYSTQIVPSVLGNYYVFNPYQTVTTGSDSEPATFQNKGWQLAYTGTRLYGWLMEGRLTLTFLVKNPTTVAHSGYFRYRLWKDDDISLGSPTDLSASWQAIIVQFDGTANQVLTLTSIIDILNGAGAGEAKILNNETMYIECLYQPMNLLGTIQLEACYSSKITIAQRTYKFSTIALDSSGYPWFGVCGDAGNGGLGYPYVVCGDALASSGTSTVYLTNVTKLSGTYRTLYGWTVVPVPLSTNRQVIAIYTYGTTSCFSQYYNNGVWNNTKVTTGANLANKYYFSTTANATNPYLCVLEGTSYDLELYRWDSTNSWASVGSVISATTSTSSPVLSFDNGTNQALYVFWMNANHVYYENYTQTLGFSSTYDWITETAITGNQYITASPYAYGNYISIAYLNQTSSPYDVRHAYLSISVPSVTHRLDLCVKDWDITDAIQNAIVTMNNGTGYNIISDANGWANYTGVSGSVTVTVTYYGFVVNGTSLSISIDTTLNLKCNLYDVTVKTVEALHLAALVNANVTVFNATSNSIRTGITNSTGYVRLLNLPNNTLTFTMYDGVGSVIANVSRAVSSDEQSEIITMTQNYSTVGLPTTYLFGYGVLFLRRRKGVKSK
jgi:hypothetical protein